MELQSNTPLPHSPIACIGKDCSNYQDTACTGPILSNEAEVWHAGDTTIELGYRILGIYCSGELVACTAQIAEGQWQETHAIVRRLIAFEQENEVPIYWPGVAFE